jgi:hypothetical protein
MLKKIEIKNELHKMSPHKWLDFGNYVQNLDFGQAKVVSLEEPFNDGPRD